MGEVSVVSEAVFATCVILVFPSFWGVSQQIWRPVISSGLAGSWQEDDSSPKKPRRHQSWWEEAILGIPNAVRHADQNKEESERGRIREHKQKQDGVLH